MSHQYKYYPSELLQRGFISFDEKAPANPGKDADGREVPPQFQPGRTAQIVEGKAAQPAPAADPKAEEAARKREIAEGVKHQTREERAARIAKDLDDDEEFEKAVTARRQRAQDNAGNEDLKRELADMKRDRAIRDLAEEHELTGDDAKRFRKLLGKYEIDELDEASREVAELIKAAAAKGSRGKAKDEDEDGRRDYLGRNTRRASTAQVPARDGSSGRAAETEDERLEREFLQLSNQEAAARRRAS